MSVMLAGVCLSVLGISDAGSSGERLSADRVGGRWKRLGDERAEQTGSLRAALIWRAGLAMEPMQRRTTARTTVLLRVFMLLEVRLTVRWLSG